MERLSDICDIVFSRFLNFFRECVIARVGCVRHG